MWCKCLYDGSGKVRILHVKQKTKIKIKQVHEDSRVRHNTKIKCDEAQIK